MSQIVGCPARGLDQPRTDTPRRYTSPRLAPDGRRVVVTAGGDLWIQDTTRPTFTRLTGDETVGNSFAVWTPNGARVVFRTQTGLQWIAADGSGRSQVIPGTSLNDYPGSVSPDGATLVFIRTTAATSADLYVLSLVGDPQPHAIVQGPAHEGGPSFRQMDTGWRVSNESGKFEVCARFPAIAVARLHAGRNAATLEPKGQGTLHREGNKMMAVDLTTNPVPVLSPPRVLSPSATRLAPASTPNYDVSLDGQRFVM